MRNPIPCGPFRDHAADVMQRLLCAQRRICLADAARANWPAWTCLHCAVREDEPRLAQSLRRGSDETATFPEVSR